MYPVRKEVDGVTPIAPNRVIIVEGNDRVGGRTHSCQSSTVGLTYDMGAQWIGPTHVALRELADALGVRSHAQHYTGKRIIDLNGVIGTYTTDIPTSVGLLGLLDLQLAMWRLDYYTSCVPADAPHTAARAKEWDAITCAAAMESILFTRYGHWWQGVVQRSVVLNAGLVCHGVQAVQGPDDGRGASSVRR